MSRTICVVMIVVLSLCLAAGSFADDAQDEKDAKKVLDGHAIRVLSRGVAIRDESKLSQAHRNTRKLKKAMLDANKKSAAVRKEVEATKGNLTRLRQKSVQLNAQLTKANPNNVVFYNKLVGAINALKGQSELLSERREQLAKYAKQVRRNLIQARENYIQHVLDMRELADTISGQYVQKAAEKEVQAALAKLNKATGKKYALTPSRSFQSNLRLLKSLEESVLSESIPLRKTPSDSLYVSVVINGKHTKEMVLDSGASLVTLPEKVAKEFGLEPKSSDPTIILVLANGSRVPAKLMTIPTVRVGKFTVSDVECAVFGPEAVNAEPLLGMSFLGDFKFEINAQAATLKMVRVETAGTSRSRTTKKPRKKSLK